MQGGIRIVDAGLVDRIGKGPIVRLHGLGAGSAPVIAPASGIVDPDIGLRRKVAVGIPDALELAGVVLIELIALDVGGDAGGDVRAVYAVKDAVEMSTLAVASGNAA